MSDLDYTDVRTQEMVENLLSAGEATVTFIKADGSERVMRCTLNMGIIPSDSAPKGTSERKKSDEVRTAFDLDAGAWRSFRWDSVIGVTA